LPKDNVCKHLTRAAGAPSFWALVLLASNVAGCSGGGYYLQAARGQLDLLAARRPISALLTDPRTAEPLQLRLAAVADIRAFAVSELGLPDNASYRSYVALDRPYVVWNVFAAPEFSVDAHEWCYPLVGCLGYRGYFRADDAEAEAMRLRARGLDVWVGGVPAYSTLGWFDDPVLSSFIHWPLGRIAELIFHELAHQRLFLRGETSFNESYATAVGRVGAECWLHRNADGPELAAYLADRERRDALFALAMLTRGRLQAIYQSGMDRAPKRAAKRQQLSEFVKAINASSTAWAGVASGERIAASGNAWFAAAAAYQQWVPAFSTLLEAEKGDFTAFHRAVETLSELPQSEWLGALRALQQENYASVQHGADIPYCVRGGRDRSDVPA
jgi:predicted aminopeptidase